ncbi:hypothetical protein RRG08_021090 [Elysia crispata]|uniref:Uncharacterized protein n=1 Tax=Elysia crispata TaxID=231223 RepID=A0AAE1ALR5_9GAST|nr:hypothetical protein RRG08_021090 [Elysia crispata]
MMAVAEPHWLHTNSDLQSRRHPLNDLCSEVLALLGDWSQHRPSATENPAAQTVHHRLLKTLLVAATLFQLIRVTLRQSC